MEVELLPFFRVLFCLGWVCYFRRDDQRKKAHMPFLSCRLESDCNFVSASHKSVNL